MTEILFFIVIIGLVGFLIFREIQHDRQISDLTTKIKAKDLNEYLVAKSVEKQGGAAMDSLEEAVAPEEADPGKLLSALKREQEIKVEEEPLKE